MALLRSDGSPYHSHVLWWREQENDTTFGGGEWGWKAATGAQDCSSYPDSALDSLALSIPPANLFCAGLTQLSGGTLAIVGGTELGTENGLKVTNIFTPGSGTSAGTWSEAESMTYARYYPTATTLADGRVLATGGSRYPELDFFGGTRSDTGNPSDSLLRFGASLRGTWESAIRKAPSPTSNWPDPLTGLTGVKASGINYYFGGRDDHGNLKNDLWTCSREDNPTGSDYGYVWFNRNPPTGQRRPDPRMDHAAVMRQSTTMIVIGGLAKPEGGSEGATNDVWRHHRNASGTAWEWTPVAIANPSTGPSARYGLSAVMDDTHDQVLVFGGKSASGAVTDYSVYALRFNPNNSDSAYWYKPTLEYAGVYPDPRYHHTMNIDEKAGIHKYNDQSLRSAVLYGGKGGSGQLYDDLWRLWISDTGDVVSWEQIDANDKPAAREGHTAIYESATSRLFVFGGNTGGSADNAVEVIDLDESTPTWRQFASYPYSISGGTAIVTGTAYNRFTECYSPSSDTWTGITSPYYQKWYPQMFQMPNGEVFAAGPALDSYTLDPATGTWAEFPASSPPDHEIVGGGAVMYRPGLVMKCGSRDTEAQDSLATSRTTWIDLTQGGSAAWADADTMIFGRVNHNLTLLPNGDVIATGGLGVVRDDENIDPRRRPEIWSATSHSWSGGSGPDSLAYSQVPRGYHSTALLLPDGRVLCGGGNNLDGSDDVADIYCPPYLFDPNGNLRTRPTLLGATGRWRYGADVTFAVSGDTTIRRACLIHPGATTHAQDEAQRYIPLTLLSSHDDESGHRDYFVKSPADSFNAPPGDYLLFVSDSSGVPGIAQWVRVGSDYSGQFDTTAPDTFGVSVEFVSANAIYPSWTAPGDDHSTGTALDYDIRFSTAAITGGTFELSSQVPTLPIPRLAGTSQSDTLSSLLACTWYYFAGRTRDRAEHWSDIGGHTKVKTLCVGGGGLNMRGIRNEARSAGHRDGNPETWNPVPAPTQLTAVPSTVRLVGTFTRGANPTWMLTSVDLSGEGSLLEASKSQVVVQQMDASHAWKTRSTFAPGAGPLGVRELARSGRVVFPAGTSLATIEESPQGYVCDQALHTRLGDLQESAATGSPELAYGDTLKLRYSTGSGEGEDCFFQVLVPSPVSQSHQETTEPGLVTSEPLPKVFALYGGRPNPFSRTTTLRFDLPRASVVTIEIFDVQGRRIQNLTRGSYVAGRHTVSWSGESDRGGRAAPGLYLVRMSAGDFTAEKRITLLP